MEVQHQGLELKLIWDAVTEAGLACCTTTPALNPLILSKARMLRCHGNLGQLLWMQLQGLKSILTTDTLIGVSQNNHEAEIGHNCHIHEDKPGRTNRRRLGIKWEPLAGTKQARSLSSRHKLQSKQWFSCDS